MRRNRFVWLVLFFMLLGIPLKAQRSVLRYADRTYEQKNYREAITLYEEYEEKKGELTDDIKVKMAKCYLFVNDLVRAIKYYEDSELSAYTPEDIFNYGVVLQKSGDYMAAQSLFDLSKEQGYNVGQVEAYIASCAWALEQEESEMEVDTTYQVELSNIETYGQSFGLQYYKNGIVYSSTGQNESNFDYRNNLRSKKVDQKGFAFLNLFYAPLKGRLSVGKPVIFSENLKFDYHVGAITFTRDYKYMYFTKILKLRSGKDVLKIFRVEFNGLNWVKETEMPFNSDDYSCAHPALSVTGDTLYFTSDKKGGLGGKDLYMVQKNGKKWGKPINMGGEVNTVGDEVFPYVDNENHLFFASDAHKGFGGLDIYYTYPENSTWAPVKNLGKPVNSSRDDFAYIMNPLEEAYGFVSSNRKENGCLDYIYAVKDTKLEKKKEKKTPQGEFLFASTIQNALNSELIPEAIISVSNQKTGQILGQGVTDASGTFTVQVSFEMAQPSDSIYIEVHKEGAYQAYETALPGRRFFALGKDGLEIRLVPIIKKMDVIRINNFHFAFDSDVLLYDSKKILEEWRTFMMKNPRVHIRLNAHTDAQGAQDYNLQLSQKRAEAAHHYLIQRGIAPERIIPRGYGERYILNNCKDGVNCSDKEHEVNRRVEIVITDI